MDGTGVPMVSTETKERIGKIAGERARTREAKLGCVFTQAHIDKKGRPIREEASTTYTGAIETAEEFGKRIYREAWKRGWSRAKKKVIIGDGAEWIWNLVVEHFPEAIEIVDLYHARQHLWDVARQLHPNEEVKQKTWMKIHQKRLLDKGKIEKLVAALRAIHTTNPQIAEKIRTEADYFERNAERMRYPQFRRQHFVCWLGCDRSCMQDGDRLTSETIGNVLDRARRQCHSRPACQPPQRSLRAILGESNNRGLATTTMSRTRGG